MSPRSLVSLLLLASSALAQTSIQFGPYFSLGATSSYIVHSETTMYPGEAPSPQQDRLALWPGMGTNGGGLYQSIVESDASPSQNCGGSSGDWCTFASTYANDAQTEGKWYPVTSSQGVTIIYDYSATTGSVTQTVKVAGKVVSTLVSTEGAPIGWGTAVECQDDCSGVVNAHSYVNTTIKLAKADSNFKSTLALYNATSTGLETDDNITFTVEKIEIQQSSFVKGAGSS